MEQERNYCVYKHTTPSGRIYIGLTKLKPEYRWNNGNGYSGNLYFFNAIRKHGWENIKKEILFENLTQEEASKKEKKYIEIFNSNKKEFGYNLTNGGELGFVMNKISLERAIETKIENNTVKLDFNKAQEIRTLYNDTETSSEFIMKKYGIGPSSLSNVINNVIWKKDGYEKTIDSKFNKLNFEDAKRIREMYQEGYSREEIGNKYGIHKRHASAIIKNIFWEDEAYVNHRDLEDEKTKFENGREIRRLNDEEGLTNEQIGNMFGIAGSYVQRIIKNEYWVDEDYVVPEISYHQRIANELREAYQSGESQESLSIRYGFKKEKVRGILRNKNYHDKNYVDHRKINAEKKDFKTACKIRLRYQESDLNKNEVAIEFAMDKSKVGNIIRNKILVDENYINHKDNNRHLKKIKKANEIRKEYAIGQNKEKG